jgi:ATP-dependent helicase/nuclease subunit B
MLLSNQQPGWLSTSVLDEVLARASAGDTQSFIFLVPTRQRSRDVNAMLVEKCAGRALGGLAVTTPIDLVSKLLLALDPGIRLLSDAEMGVFLELTIKRLLDRSALQYFERKAAMSSGLPIAPGTFDEILSTIRKLREHDVLPGQLVEEIASLEQRRGRATEIRRAKDMLAIYSDYLEQIGDRFVDTYGQFRLLRDLLDRSSAAGDSSSTFRSMLQLAYGNVSDVFLEGFIRLEPSTYLLLRQLTEEVRVTIELPDAGTNEKLYAPSKRLEREAFRAGFVHSVSLAPSSALHPGALLQRELVDGKLTTSFTDAIRIYKAQDRAAEVEAIARQIKTILETDPEARANPSRICVASFVEREYTMLFRSTFEQCGIPASITDRYRLEHASLTSGLIAIFELIENGYRRRELRRVLASPYFRFKRSDDTPVDAVNLLNVADRERLSGNWKAWQSRLSSRIRQLEDEIQNATDAGDDLEARRTSVERAAAVTALTDYAIVTDLIGFFEKPLRPSAFRAALSQLFFELGVAEAILRDSDIVLAEHALERDARAYGTLVKLVEDLTSIFTLLNIDDDEEPLEFYLERLKTAAQIKRFTPRFDPGSVYVTSLEQILGLDFDYLFIPGLVDGVFPSTFEPQVFLLSSLQKEAESSKLEEERLLFSTVVTKFKKKLMLSWPAHGAGSNEQSRSIFLTELMQLLGRKEEDVIETGGIYSLNELYEFAGGELARNGNLDRLNLESLEKKHSTQHLRAQLPRAIAMQQHRMSASGSEWTGQVDLEQLNEHERATLQKYADRTWSVSQLESYANCPFKFLTEGLFRFDSPDEEEDGFTKMEQGNLLHKVLYEIFTERREAKNPALADLTSEEEIESFKARANVLARQHLQPNESSHPFYRLDAERMLGNDSVQSVWDRVVAAEKMLTAGSQRPAYFEVSFGSLTGSSREQESQLSTDEPVTFGRVKLRGKIDRIDMDGETFSVVDYKSGKVKSFNDIKRGTSLQLLIYMKVAEELINRERLTNGDLPLRGIGSIYESLKDGNRALGIVLKEEAEYRIGKLQSMRTLKNESLPKGPGVLTDEEIDELLAQTIARVERYVGGIQAGTFQLAAVDLAPTVCKNCGVKNACRYREADSFDALPTAR